MTKKVYKQNFFVCHNLNWEILTKNLVTFKIWDGVKDKNFLILWRFTEKSDF